MPIKQYIDIILFDWIIVYKSTFFSMFMRHSGFK